MTRFEHASVKRRLSLADLGEVVLIDCKIATNCDSARNVFLLNPEGDVLWQIETGGSFHGVIGYSDIYFDPNNKLMAYSRDGIEYEIDPTSGRVLGKELIR
jgi:hypothetical protein